MIVVVMVEMWAVALDVVVVYFPNEGALPKMAGLLVVWSSVQGGGAFSFVSVPRLSGLRRFIWLWEELGCRNLFYDPQPNSPAS